ncbi:MAG: GEVED domain-containing protein, partial [Xanthomonadales bacterium]|nr:GEVED domain-containing protein [Xanthomonadales bacterium]
MRNDRVARPHDRPRSVVHRWACRVVLALLLTVGTAFAAQVQHLNTQTASATSSGSAGTPGIASFNIPAGKNRILFIWPAFERDHCSPADDAASLCAPTNIAGTGLGDNYPEPRIETPPASSTNNQITARVVGPGGSIDKQNALVIGGTPSGDTRFLNISNSPPGSPAGTAYFSISNFYIVLFENEISTLLGGAASGTVAITIPDVSVPASAGDDALLIVSVFQNVDQTVQGAVRNATGTAQITLGTPGNYSISPAAYDAGQVPDEADDGKLVLATNSTPEGFATPAGHVQLANISTNNAGGIFDTSSGNNSNEPNGFSTGLYFRNGGATPGSLFTVASAASASPTVYGGAVASFLLESDNADVGDAPISYGNATHTLSGIRLGAGIDADSSLLNNPLATGDDSNNTDDEDGVTLVPAITAGTTVTVPVSIQSASGFLNVWFDWNRDGDFLDAGEQMVSNQAVAAGTTNLSIPVPSAASVGSTYARFRVCTNNSALDHCATPTGTVQSGEVEDYQFNILSDPCAAISFPYTLPNNLPATLTQAIECANANGTADVIDLNGQTVTLTASFADYNGATGLPQVTTPLTVRNGTITRTGSAEFRFIAVSGSGINLTLRDLTLTNGGGTTYAFPGGSVRALDFGTLTVVNTRIAGSRTAELQNGSAIFSNGPFTIVNSSVVGNASSRGALALSNGPVLIQNTLLSGNVGPNTTNSGGAVFLSNMSSAVIENSTIAGNYILTANNTQPAGIFASTGTVNLTIRNSIIWGNSNNGNTSPQVVNSTVGTTTVSNSIIQGGQFGALNVDPLFITPITASATPSTAGNFAVQNDSPAIDAGANANVPADTFDVDGDSNTSEDAPDRAGNPRRYNDTGVTDTGSGTPPIVDLGAFEKQTNSANPCSAVTFPYTLPDNLPATLIQAIECANANGTADVINLNGQTVTLTASFADYSGATGLPQVTTDVTLRNGTITRSGANEFRLLSASNAATLRLTDLTLSNGGGAGYAGRLSSQGSLFLTRVTMSGHRSTVAGGAIAIPSLQSGATVSILDSTLGGNTAQGGGAISFTPGVSGTVNLSGSTLATNVGTSGPGAIFISGTGAAINIRNSTFSANSASNTAAPDAIGVFSSAQADIAFSTFSGHDSGSNASTVGIIHVTGSASVNLRASVIANNVRTGGGTARECTASSATFTGNGNYTADSLCPSRVATPLFVDTVLANNGGPTQTHLPAPHSNVVNADSGNLCAPANLNLSIDQRGEPRPRGPACDIGAVEIDACGSITFPYTLPNNAPATLNAAIDCANSTAAIADVIDLNGQTVTLTQSSNDVGGATGVMSVRSPITLRNGTLTRGGSNPFRLLHASANGNLTLRNLTLSNGGGASYSELGNLISTDTGSALTIIRSVLTGGTGSTGSGGGAIFASGALSLINSTISGNTAGRGGAITAQNGPLLIANSVISGNVATNTTSGGGAMTLNSMTANDARIINSTITGNYALGSNRTGGIAGETSGVDLILQNSIVWGNGNAGTAAPQIVNAAASSSNTVTNSLIQGGLFGALDSDPLFVTPLTASGTPSTAGNFALQNSSPAIDAGANANVPADAFDVNGNSNTAEEAPDRADNPRRYNDTGVADTGSGTAPIVDLGAFEKQTNSTLPQLTLTKTASAPSFAVGTPASFTLQVSNTGTVATTAVATITDTIPAGLTIGTLPSGCTAAAQTVTCTRAAGLAAGGNTSFVIPVTATLAAAASITNTATVSGAGDATCPAATRCSSSVTISVTGTCAAFAFPYTLAGADNTARVSNLRSAIQCANLNGTADIIDLNGQTVTLSDSFGNFFGATGLPQVTTALTVRNGTITRSGSNEFRFLSVSSTGTLTLRNLTLSNGGGTTYLNNGGSVTTEFTSSVLNVVNSTISGSRNDSLNFGSAINANGTLTVVNSNITGGGFGPGAVSASNGPVLIQNTLIAGNSAGTATNSTGGLRVSNVASATVINSTIVGNYTDATGTNRSGGIVAETGTVNLTVRNSIVWGNRNNGNTAPQIRNLTGGATTVTNSLIEGGFTGSTNILSDPLFLTPLIGSPTPSISGNFQLGAASPAVDAGANANVPADSFDIDGDTNTTEDAPDLAGNPRRYDDTGVTDTGSGTAPIVDLGAFEKQTNSTAPADFNITTTANSITVTDATGNGSTLQASEPVANTLRFDAAGRTFSINGSPPISGNSGNLALTGITSITVNAAGGVSVASGTSFNIGASAYASASAITLAGGTLRATGTAVVNA